MKKNTLLWTHNNQCTHLVYRKHRRRVPLHTHNFDEIVFVLSGSCIHSIGKGKYPLIRGDVFVIKEGQMHRFEKNRNEHFPFAKK